MRRESRDYPVEYTITRKRALPRARWIHRVEVDGVDAGVELTRLDEAIAWVKAHADNNGHRLAGMTEAWNGGRQWVRAGARGAWKRWREPVVEDDRQGKLVG